MDPRLYILAVTFLFLVVSLIYLVVTLARVRRDKQFAPPPPPVVEWPMLMPAPPELEAAARAERAFEEPTSGMAAVLSAPIRTGEWRPDADEGRLPRTSTAADYWDTLIEEESLLIRPSPPRGSVAEVWPHMPDRMTSVPAEEPALVAVPEPEPLQAPEPAPVVVPEPLPAPEPAPVVVPEPLPAPEPAPVVVPEPEPAPVVVPEPAPVPVVVPEPVVEPVPLPMAQHHSTAEWIDELVAQLEGETAPEPEPLPAPEPEPQLAPEPEPQPPVRTHPDVPEHELVAPVEMWFGDVRIGVKPGTKTYDRFQRIAQVLFDDLKKASSAV